MRVQKAAQSSGITQIEAPLVSGPPPLVEPNAPSAHLHPTSVPHRGLLGGFFGRHPHAVAAVVAGLMLATTSALAPGRALANAHTAAPQSAEEVELNQKITRLVNAPPYNGDLRAAFNAFDTRAPHNALDRTELRALLERAGIGNPLTRGFWVDGVIEKMDSLPGAQRNGRVDWSELQTLLGP